MYTKKEARERARSLRQELSSNEVITNSQVIAHRLFELPCYKDAKNIYIYSSINNEVDTSEIIAAAFDDGKTVAFPRVNNDEMIFYRVDSVYELEFGFLGILEPKPDENKLIESDNGLVIMPGVAFDEQLHRIGYGGGYYDKFLSKHCNLHRVALAYECQIFDEVDSEINDILPEMIITEERIITA